MIKNKNRKNIYRKIITTNAATMVTSTMIVPIVANASQVKTYNVSNQEELINALKNNDSIINLNNDITINQQDLTYKNINCTIIMGMDIN